MTTFPVLLVSLYICIFVVGISILTKILPSFRRPEIKWLILFITAVCLISFCSLNVYLLDSFEAKVLFSRWRFMGFAVVAQAWFFFLLLTFTNIKVLRHPLFVVPVLLVMLTTVTIAMVPSLGHLLTTNYSPYHYNGTNLVKFSNGPWFGLHILQVYIFAFVATAYVVFTIPFSSGPKRKQLIALSIGGIIGIFVDAYSVYVDNSLRWVMISGGSFLISELSILYAIKKHGLLDLSSIAKNQIFDGISNPVLILDQKQNLIDFNHAAKLTFKMTNESLYNQFKKIPLFENFDISRTNQEWVFGGSSDSVRHYQVTSETLKSYSGRILIFRETTLQKEIEKNLHSHLGFKAKLLEMIAHDFSGILSAQSYLSSQLEKEVAPELKKHAGNLTDSAYAGKDFMSNILSWARAQNNQFKPVVRDYELNTLISDVVNNLESIWQLQDIKIEIESQVSPLLLKGDAVMIESVIRNLLTNAIRATSSGGRIKMSLSVHGEEAVLSVADDGIGMGPEKLEVLRSSAFSTFDDKAERPHGFGIGLIMAKRFVELHNGQLEFSSVLGEGTSVELTLPLQKPGS